MTETTTNPRTYGAWSVPASPGLPRLGLFGTTLALAFLSVAVIVQAFAGFRAALVVAALGALVVAPLAYRTPAGRNGWQTAITAGAWAVGKARRQNVYLAGLTEPLAFTTTKLPGLLAGSRLYEHDGVALVHLPGVQHWTALLRVDPDGASLVDRDVIDTQVAWWGKWIADLGHEPNLIAASVTVETAPDPGVRLAREVDHLLAPSAPALARDVLRHAAATYPNASATTRCHVALTWRGLRGATEERELARRSGPRQGRYRSPEEMAQIIATRLPGLARSLSATGAGTARPMTAAEVTEYARAAYQPSAATDLEELRAEGEDTGLTWDTVGPAGAVEGWDRYTHDDAASVTWSMAQAPRGVVEAHVLGDLLGASADVVRKRVTILYRVHSAAESAAIADRDLRAALGQTGTRAGVDRAHVTAAAAAAQQAAREEAAGAGLVRFALLVTASVLDPADLPQAVEAVDQLGRASRLRLRRVVGAQSAAFATCLGLGVVPSAHVNVGPTIQEWL
jgi:hypothetical protein